METLQKTTLSPTKFKYPFWMKTIRNLFYIGIGFAFLFLAWYILFDTDLSIIKLITGFSIILSLYFYFRILRLLPNSESSSRVQIKRALSLDIAQLFLFFVGIFGLFFIMGEPGNEEGFIMGHIFRTVISTFWLILWLIYFSFSKSVKEYYTQNLELVSILDWIFFVRYIFSIVVLIWGLYELKEYFYSRRGRLDVILNLSLTGIHIYIISILSKTTKDIPERVNFLLSIALSSYFVHHLAQYFFYSEELGEMNYHLVQACLIICWCGFWLFIFTKSKVILSQYTN